jgi:hypothetical protein
MQLSKYVALPKIAMDWLNATGMAAAVAAAVATNSWHMHYQEQRANVLITPPRGTSASKTGCNATLTVLTSTTGTPAGHAPNRAPRTIHTNKN